MIRSTQARPYPVRLITPPRRDRHGGISPAWLLIQAARLSWEIRKILQLINGMRLNLSEELQIQCEASDMLLNAAHATAVMEARLPLAPAWGSGPPRARSIFAQAREAGSDPAEVCAEVIPPRPHIDPQITHDVQAAFRADPDPDAQCAGTTTKKERCAKTIVRGIGSAHCAVHLTPMERQQRDELRAAQDRRMHAIQDALDDQRQALADTWTQRYGCLPHRLELPAPPSRARRVLALDGDTGLKPGEEEQAMLALYDTGWPALCPRAAEIISTLMDCPRATTTRLAELAAAQTPHRWSSPEQWLESSIWDGVRPPGVALPAAGQDPALDEYPPVQMLRRHLDDDQTGWERWQAGFATLVEACDDPPVDTMADLVAFWQDIGILISRGGEGGHPLWTLDASPPSPWRVVHSRGPAVPPHILAAALDWLLDEDVPVDAELPPREVFTLLMTSSAHHGSAANIVTSGASAAP
ncbi:hypothetical protein [Nonomuraea sp. NPDC049480]|uniref:hypothetical protein n=1 Tax=Nonomuraea sp. NPDC049480 TaxID=3364353 RepID=UPI0037B44938